MIWEYPGYPYFRNPPDMFMSNMTINQASNLGIYPTLSGLGSQCSNVTLIVPWKRPSIGDGPVESVEAETKVFNSDRCTTDLQIFRISDDLG